MAEGRLSNIKNWLRESNLKTFLLFLVFSTVVWVLVQLAEDYKETVSFPITYTNVPKDVLLDNPPTHIKATAKLTGFRLIILKVLKPDLAIDLSNLSKNIESNVYRYNIEEHINTLTAKLNLKNSQPSFYAKAITIPYNQKQVKLLPVVAQTKLSFAPGYSKISAITLTPDSIQISGSKEDLNKIDTLYTEVLRLENLKENQQGRIRIAADSLTNIALYQSEVSYTLEVDKFTEGRFQIPVKIKNVPTGSSVSIFPKEVEISFQTTLENYEAITAGEFKIVKDFNDLNRDQSFFIPEITKQPKNAVQVKALTNKVQYIIKE